MNIGLLIFLIKSIFLNLSASTKLRKYPTRSLATSLMLLNGDIKIIAAGFLIAPKKQLGEHPILLPNMIISLSSTPKLRVK